MFNNFNSAQLDAIHHNKGPAIVLAGPGSGKTTVITHRVKNLIVNEKVPPEKILVVTFTRDAATHMQHKFMELMKEGSKNVYPVSFGTFHSIFFRILKNTYSYSGDCIVTEKMKCDYLKEIIVRLKIDVGVMSDFIQDIVGDISRFKGNMYEDEEYEPTCCGRKNFEKILKEYEKKLRREQKLDFEDMLIKCYELFKTRKTILKQWQETYSYILIDEFQDINRVQYEIIKMLALPENNIFIVGDDDQSIYGFRGACPEIMFDFKVDYENAREILLSVNYRSVSEIIEHASNLIECNKHRFFKKIVSGRNNSLIDKQIQTEKNNLQVPSAVNIRKFRNQMEELKFMADKIKEYVGRGICIEDMAILVRNNNQITMISDFLKNEMIATYNRKNKRNTSHDGMVARDVLAYIKASLDVYRKPLGENENLVRILNKPERFIGRQIFGEPGMNFKSLTKVYFHNKEIRDNIEKLQFHMNMIRGLNPYSAMMYIRYGAGYEGYLRQYAIEKKIPISNLVKQFDLLQNEAAGFQTLEEWIEYMEMPETDDIYKNSNYRNCKDEKYKEKVCNNGNCKERVCNNSNCKERVCSNGNSRDAILSGINIMTMHGAKGLEFKVVFIVDANQGIIPSSKSVRERDFQEERRVFYVAVTRAADELNIYYPMESLGCKVEMSMFIGEMLKN